MATHTQRTAPGPLPMSAGLRITSIVLMAIGVVTFALTLMKNPDRAWFSYLTSYYYFFLLAIGGLFFASIQHLTRAGWSVNVRRFCEAFTGYLPVAAVGALLLLVAGHHLYEWMDKAAVAEDELLRHKSAYLNVPFFLIRTVVFFALWMLFRGKLVGMSLTQDKTGEDALSEKSVGWSIGFLLTFAISFSLFAVDLIMSLQPHWFSTIFGVYCFAGLFQSTMAAMILLILYCRKQGLLEGYVDENHLHDLGKFMFAFTVFWAYIAYSQYMLIWYANMPEETVFYIPRVSGTWMYMSAALLLFKFIVPFLVLLSRRAKRNPAVLTVTAVMILVMQYVDLHWLIYPNLDDQNVLLGLPEVGLFCGFLGAFLFTTFTFLSKNAIVPLKDPRLQESMHHHVVY